MPLILVIPTSPNGTFIGWSTPSGPATSHGGFWIRLIPVIYNNINGKEIQTVSSRKLYSFLKVGRDYTSWIKGRIKQYGFIEGSDYFIVENLSSPKRGSTKFRQQMSMITLLASTWVKSYLWLSVTTKES
ncbi:antA/AntB antirepressor family protein [Providencia sneebia]|uniref:antA/AntB antirepressor family protein n=1 Tax=Providencia sneebia TaxID=516075 RepID=UPI003AF3299E